jgi:hypothetical protein
MLKKKKPTKALEQCARGIKDTDEFVEHVTNIAARYRHEHALDTGPRNAAVRKALRDFQRHAAVLATWLRQAHKANQSTAELDALNKMSVHLHGVPSVALSESKPMLAWLVQTEQAAARGVADLKPSRKTVASAPRIAGEALCATFEHHKLKWSAVVTRQRGANAMRHC